MNLRERLSPAEGWLTVGLVTIMCLTLARAFDDSRWVLGREEYLDYLVFAALGGVLCGFIGPKVGWGRWTTFLIGSIFAALLVPLMAAAAGATAWAWFDDLYTATASSAVQAYIDIAIQGRSSTTQYLHHILVISLIVWATSMFASYAVFGHRRPLAGIVVVGLVLVANMAITLNDQLPFLVLFSLAALLILVRSHVYDEESEWLRRRIGDPGTISAVYLRGGTTFIAVTVIAAFILTQTASSAPLRGAWTGVEDGLLTISRAIQPLLPPGGPSRNLGPSFGPGALGQVWSPNPGVAVTVRLHGAESAPFYWRVEAFDLIEPRGRSHSQEAETRRARNENLFDQMADDPGTDGVHAVTFTVIPADYHQPAILSPVAPTEVDEAVRVVTTGDTDYFAKIDRDGGSGAYDVTAEVRLRGDGPGELNESALRATPTTYPDELKRLYLQLPDGIIGVNARKLEVQIAEEAGGSTAPIDLADAAVAVLGSSEFDYDTDISDIDCAGVSNVECFATYKRGFCQYYAVTMAAILRDLGVPTRIVEGFLPGSRDRSGTEVIDSASIHEWVEVYFPGYGWVEFDPTPASVSQLAPLPTGPPQASGSPGPAASAVAQPSRRDPRENEDPNALSGSILGSGGPGSLGPLVAVGLLLVIVVVGLAFLAWQRGPRGATNVDGAYGMVIRIASRLGFRPRPAETIYEYAGALGDVLPDVRPELQTVAQAKVESVYGRQLFGDERLAAINAAQRRLRVGLFRLAFRRRERGRR